MSEINNGGAAFPSHGSMGEVVQSGMSLRDHFAGLAMQGFLSGHVAHYGHESYWPYEQLPRCAFEVSDAMLKTREGTQP